MKLTTSLLLALSSFPLSSGAVVSREVPLVDARFDEEPVGTIPAGWSSIGGGLRVVATEGGGQALRLEAPPAGGELLAISGTIRLEVGKLYRLSARIQAIGVSTDPAARYPTPQGACLSMESFPFTNGSPQAAGDVDRRVEKLFFATSSSDRIRLHLGKNGPARGAALFDDVRLERVDDVTAYIPLETVRWAGKGFRYDDGGWIFVHVEGEPWERGRQYGELVADEIGRFAEKLATLEDKGDPEKGWARLRKSADALFLRKWEPEYLEEMKGIADGAAKGGAKIKGRKIDLLDVVTMNSAIDLGQVEDALRVTPTPLSGRTFRTPDDETDPAAASRDRCSSFVATGSATKDGRFVMGQLFMWNGYTGVHWDLFLDVVPSSGHRVVLQTFPGGIASGSDWYMNDAGIVIGETTVGQTPFEPSGTPQANRSRKGAQYGSSIDDVARILAEGNNGLYTNDWTMADAKSDEGGDLLLGTRASKLWRTGSEGHPADTPGGLVDFVWANNNSRDAGVRREYATASDDLPQDLSFYPWNRDVAFWRFYQEHGKGEIGLDEATRFLGSSPTNRPHACDGKITTGEMAEKLVFLAHYGKTTLREKWVGSRFVADLPGAVPHLSLDYTTFSPIVVAEGLAAAKSRGGEPPKESKSKLAEGSGKELLSFDEKLVWKGSLEPAGPADAWASAGSAAYAAILKKLPEEPGKALDLLHEALADQDLRGAWFAKREGVTPPSEARLRYDAYGPSQHSRIRGLFVLHQLRLELGNALFSKAMTSAHGSLRGRPATTAEVLGALSKGAGRDLRPFLEPWLLRSDTPDPKLEATVKPSGKGWKVDVRVSQGEKPWGLRSFVELRGEKTTRLEPVRIEGTLARFSFTVDEKPRLVRLSPTNDFPVVRTNPYSLPNILDDFDRLLFVVPTEREVEAGNSLTRLWRDVVADASIEILPPVVADASASDAELASRDLVLLGGPSENALVLRLARERRLPLEAGKGFFRWKGNLHADRGEGISLAFPNPWNSERVAWLHLANSKLALWRMVRSWTRGLPSWALWKDGDVVEKGDLGAERLEAEVR
jgi:hypothetical protein